ACDRIDARAIPSLVDAPAMSTPRELGAARILATMLPLTFLSAPRVFPSVVARSVELALEAGPTAQSAIAVAAFGILLASQGRYRDAEASGRAGIAISERFGDLSQRCKAGEIHIACLAHWVAPLRDSQPQADDAYDAGIDAGELQYAGYTR